MGGRVSHHPDPGDGGFEAPSIIAGLTEQAAALSGYLPSGDELLADAPAWCGQVRIVERKLAEWRQATEKAILEESGDAAVRADGWEVRATPKREWQVNLQRVLVDLSRWNEWETPQAMNHLVGSGALVLSWKISKLRDFFAAQGLSLDEKKDGAPDDVLDVDGPHAARIKTGSSVSRERVDDV